MLDEAENTHAVILDERPEEGVILVNGKRYRPDAKGNLVPEELVKPELLLEDQTVREILGYARPLSAQITRFRDHTLSDIGVLLCLLEEKYGVSRGGKKGNLTLMSFDGLLKVHLQVADINDFGPQLQIAKLLIDECLMEWAADSRPEIRSVVTRAYKTDKEGQINRSDLFSLLQLEIEDERWQRAMDALRDAIRVVGSKEYIHFYERARPDGEWKAVTINLAKA